LGVRDRSPRRTTPAGREGAVPAEIWAIEKVAHGLQMATGAVAGHTGKDKDRARFELMVDSYMHKADRARRHARTPV